MQINTIELGYILQRLFSTFPNSWPGAGLLLLRLTLSAALLSSVNLNLTSPSGAVSAGQKLIAAIGAILLLAGLSTPVAGAIVVFNEAWIVFSLYSARAEGTWLHVYVASVALSVVLLGPGAWSMDARLFGRQRFDIDRSRGKK